MLFDLEAFAIQIDGFPLSVTAKAELNNSCYEAKIADIYPGGNITYVEDPGVAQLFVKVTRYDRLCFQAAVPWSQATTIYNAEQYKQLEVILTFEREGEDDIQEEKLRIGITRTPPVWGNPTLAGSKGLNTDEIANELSEKHSYLVVALSGSSPPTGCMVVHVTDIIPAIYSRVFGPATKGECRKWQDLKCSVT